LLVRRIAARPFISFVDDVVEIFGPWRAQGFQSEIVEDQETGAHVARKALLVGAVGAAADEMRELLSVLLKMTSWPRRQAS
jgi:hypothetical protein